MSSESDGNRHVAVTAANAEMLEYLPARLHVPPAGTRPVFGWGLVMFPPLVAVLCWPAFFAVFFVMSFTLALMAVAACLYWAWRISDRLACWRYWARVRAGADGSGTQPPSHYRVLIRLTLFAGQSVGILSSCPLFWLVLKLASRRGMSPMSWWLGRHFI